MMLMACKVTTYHDQLIQVDKERKINIQADAEKS